MRHLRALLHRVAGLFGGARRDGQLDAEIASHIELHAADNIRAGMSPDEARRAALIAFGGVEAAKDSYRDRRGLPVVETLWRDVRYGVRVLRRSPGITAACVLSLALGTGANTAIFSILNSLVLRSLPVREPDRLVLLQINEKQGTWSNPLWEQIRSRPELFDGACAWSPRRLNAAPSGEADLVDGLLVSGRFFDVFGVQPILGRTFNETDDLPRGGSEGPAAVISEGMWRRRFGGAPDVLGKPITIERVAFTIVGVSPARFFGPDVGRSFDVAVPIGVEPLLTSRSLLTERSAWWLSVIARLKPAQTVETATAAFVALQPQIRQATLPTNYRAEDLPKYLKAPFNITAAAGGVSRLRRAYLQPLVVVMVVVGLVLLIACANIANLLLARADARRHEMSVRLALGASRGRLVRQLLVESLLLAVAGGIAGLFVAWWGSALLVRQLSTASSPVFLALSLDWRVLAFTAGIAITMALLFGVAPALRASRVQPHDAIKGHGRLIAGQSRWSAGSAIVSMQVALCLILIVGAGLFVRSFTSLQSLDPGFDADRVLMVSLNGRASTTPPEARTALYVRIADAVGALPGVARVGLSAMTPLAGEWDTLIENTPGMHLAENDRDVYLNAVTPEWFAVYGMPLVAGRGFDAHDRVGAPPVAIVNQAFAAKYFPAANPLGQTAREVGAEAASTPVIVGVVRDAIYDSLRGGAPPTMYYSWLANKRTTDTTLSVRVNVGEPAAVARAIAASVASIDSNMVLTFEPLETRLDASIARERITAMLAGFFGGLALLLSAIGLYGVVSDGVARRRTEIGIRMALGASAAGVVRLIVARVALLVGIGLAIGAGLSLWASTYVATLLFGLQPRDAGTFVGAAAILAAIAIIASWLPARRASRIEPTIVLREG